MARSKGSANFAGSLEVLAGAPIDARQVVDSVSDLTAAGTFSYSYIGMTVATKDTGKLYMLVGADVTDSANWKEIGSGGSSIMVDDEISDTSENPVQNKVIKGALDNKVDKETGKGLSTNDYDDTAKAVVDGLSDALNGKVDKVTGKGLSTNDYTDDDKAIVGGVTAALGNKADKTTVGDLDDLNTTLKTDIVTAINEVNVQRNGALASGTLLASGWSSNQQTVSVVGVRADNVGAIGLTDENTTAQIQAAGSAQIKPVSVGNGTITFECVTVPTIDIPFGVLIGGSPTTDKDVECNVPRWLRFDPSNKKGLVIKAGTTIKTSSGGTITYSADTKVDLTSYVTQAGKDYFVNLADNGTITASTSKLTTGVTIGRFHTLCVNVGTATMIAPTGPNSGLTTSSYFLVKGYRQEDDPDFYAFYNKRVTAISANTDYYDVVTVAHPLSGFTAGSILPESVFCLSFHPETLYEDAMVYDVDTGRAVDVYLQSGTGHKTRSAYGATHTVMHSQWEHAEDMRTVGKRLLRDYEFTSASLGSNQQTSINGAADATTVGGHSDTASRRMISAIGCEEMCGYLWQWLDELVFSEDKDTTNHWVVTDGRGLFGENYWEDHVLLAGGAWNHGARCGSRARASNGGQSLRSAAGGGRGSSRVVRCA